MDRKIVLGGQAFSANEIAASKNGFELMEPKLQMKLLDAYRLTEEYRKAYGEYMFAIAPKGLGVKAAVDAIKKFRNMEAVDVEAHRELIVDLLYSRYVLGFLHWEYFCYGFEEKSIEDRLEYMSNVELLKYYKTLNQDKVAARTLGNKFSSYKKFKRFYKRDAIKVAGISDRMIFQEFCETHRKMILKPVGGAMGRRIEIMDLDNYTCVEAAFLYLIEMGGAIICEELIEQSAEFRQMHENSVNTVRVFTYNNREEVRIVCAWLKAGRGGAIVDNGGAGGMLAGIDTESGIVVSNARDEAANTYEVHPDSGFRFCGFKVPLWEELRELAKQLATELPGVPMIGWDFAMSKEKEWQLIEGNEGGQLFLVQIPMNRGMKKELEQVFEWDKWKKN